jgi:hypothetical protein
MSALLLALLAGAPFPQAAQLVLVSTPVIVGTRLGSEAAEFSVTNTADQAVTAWEVAIELTYSDNSVLTKAMTRESYYSYATNDSEGHFIPPSGSAQGLIIVGREGRTVVAMRSAVRWAVFADGTWVGDRAGVEDTFRQRAREYEAWTIVRNALRSALSAASARQGLSLALARLSTPDQEDFEHPVKRQMRQNLQWAIAGDATITVSSDEFLKKWLSTAEERIRVTDAHRRQAAVRD